MKKAIRITSILVVAAAVVLLLIAGVTQTQFFRNRLRELALSRLDSLLAAEVYLGEFHGNLIAGFSVDSMSISVGGEQVLCCREMELRYNLLGLSAKKLSVSSLTLVEPSIRLTADRTGSWNFTRMIRPTGIDTSGSGPFDWNIALDQLVIKDGKFRLIDSAAFYEPDHGIPDTTFVEYHDVTLDRINVEVSARLTPDEKRLRISSLSFVSSRPGLIVQRLSLEAVITGNGATVREFQIRTPGTDLWIQASLQQVDLLKGIVLDKLQHKPLTLEMHAKPIDFDELQKFLEPLRFLRGAVGVSLSADGEFGRVNVQQLVVERGETALHFTGQVSNLHDPDNLQLNVTMNESILWPGDPLTLMPSFDLPDYTGMGKVLLKAEFSGTPLDFMSRLQFSCEAGECPGAELHLRTGGPKALVYDGRCEVRKIDFGRIFGMPGLSSAFTGVAEIHGEGVTLSTLNSTMQVGLDSSVFRGLPVRAAQISAHASGKQASATAEFSVGGLNALITSSFDGRRPGEPGFSVNGALSGLDLAELLQNPENESDIVARLNARGTGLSLRTVSGTMVLDLSASRYRGYTWDSGAVEVSIDQRDPGNTFLDVRSTIADVSLRGAFDLAYMVDLVQYESKNILNALGERLAPFDSTLAHAVNRSRLAQAERELSLAARRELATKFRINVKNLDPLAVILGDRVFDGQAELVGSMHGNHRTLDVQGTLGIKEFFIGTAESGVLLQDAAISFAVDSLTASTVLEDIDANLTARIARLNVNRSEIDSIAVKGMQHDGNAKYAMGAILDQSSRIEFDGTARVAADSLSLIFDNVDIAHRTMRWRARPGARLDITADVLRVRQVVMEQDSETVALEGTLTTDGQINAWVAGAHLNLGHLRYLIRADEQTSPGATFSGGTNLDALVRGSLRDPEYTVHLWAEGIGYRSIPFGTLEADLRYAGRRLAVDLQAWGSRDSVGRTPDLQIGGTVPLDLSFVSPGDRFPDGPMDLRITSRGMQISVLDPLLPTFNDLSGTVTSDLHVVGSLHHPDYQGSIDLTGCTFLFAPNNIPYQLEGRFRPEGDRIKVLSAVMQNVPEDLRGRATNGVNINGDFALRGLSLEDFNLFMTGDLLVVKETTRKSNLSVYGNLAVEIGRGGLHFTGSMEHSLLKGSLLISNSALVFPPTQEVVAAESQLTVPVVFVDDTVSLKQNGTQTAADRYFGRRNGNTLRSPVAEVPSPSFTDGLRYDLAIEATGGSAEIRMIFNPITGEELVAAINGKFLITDDGKRWFGDLLVERGYYFFFKRFNAEGRIRYTGEFLNPVLDITARYQGNRIVRDSTENVVVTFNITGSRDNPKVEHHMTIDQVDYPLYRGFKSNDVQSDAIAFIITGSFPLSAAQKNEVASDLTSTARLSLLTGAASLLTGTLSEYLRDQTGFIRSVEFSYGSGRGVRESADVRLSGTAWKGYWRYGGKILEDPLTNANFSLMYSVGSIFDNPALNNLMLELERRVESGSAGQTANDIKRVNSAKVFYRFSF